MGCLLSALEPKNKCGIEGCQLVLHHMHQTEWESYQYNDNPSLSKYDSGGKKRCIHHHPHSKLAFRTALPSTAEAWVENSSSKICVASKGSVSQSTSLDRTLWKKTNAKDMDTHHVAEQKQLSVLKSSTTTDLYPRAIQEMYPGINTGWL